MLPYFSSFTQVSGHQHVFSFAGYELYKFKFILTPLYVWMSQLKDIDDWETSMHWS